MSLDLVKTAAEVGSCPLEDEEKENVQTGTEVKSKVSVERTKENPNTDAKIRSSTSKSKHAEEMRRKLEEWRARKGRSKPGAQSLVKTSQSVKPSSERKSILATRQSLLPSRLKSDAPIGASVRQDPSARGKVRQTVPARPGPRAAESKTLKPALRSQSLSQPSVTAGAKPRLRARQLGDSHAATKSRSVTTATATSKTATTRTKLRTSSTAVFPADKKTGVTGRSGVQAASNATRAANKPGTESRRSLAVPCPDSKASRKRRCTDVGGILDTGSEYKTPRPSAPSSRRTSRRLSFTISTGPNPELEGRLSDRKKIEEKRAGAASRPSTAKSILRRSVAVPTQTCKGDNSLKHSTQVRFTSPCDANAAPRTSYRKTPVRSQQSLRSDLNAWLVAQNRTPSKFRHMMCFDAEMSARKKTHPRSTPCLTVGQMTRQQQVMEEENIEAVPLISGPPASLTAEGKETTGFVGEATKGDNSQEEDLAMPLGGLTDSLIQEELESLLEECTRLLEAGCPSHSILAWLEKIQQSISVAVQSASFHRCCIAAMLAGGNLAGALDGLENAIRCGAQPAERMADTFREVMQQVIVSLPAKAAAGDVRSYQDPGSPDPVMPTKLTFDPTSTPGSSPVQEGEREGEEAAASMEEDVPSSAVKFMVTRVTPFNKSSARKSRTQVESEEGSLVVVTPVRRSTRLSLTATPQSVSCVRNLQSSAPSNPGPRVLDCLEELTSPELRAAILKPNPALGSPLPAAL